MKAFLSAVAVPLPLKIDPFPLRSTPTQDTKSAPKAVELDIQDGERFDGIQEKTKKIAQPVAFLLAPL